MKTIRITPDLLDDIINDQDHKFLYFTVRNGKAKYDLIHLPDRSVGIYYAIRVGEDGYLEAKRALHPSDEIVCHVEPKK